MEVELAKQFAKAGLGMKPRSEMHGFNQPSHLTTDDMHDLLAGPDFNNAPPKALRSALGRYAMERFDYTLYFFIEGRH